MCWSDSMYALVFSRIDFTLYSAMSDSFLRYAVWNRYSWNSGISESGENKAKLILKYISLNVGSTL